MNIRTSSVILGGHGNQATYDINGNLITSGVAAESADYVHTSDKLGHLNYDVLPFLEAAELDGNGFVLDFDLGIPIPRISDPITIKGSNLDKYFEVRPVR